MFKDAFSNFIKFPSKIHKSSSSSSEKEKSSDFFKVEPIPSKPSLPIKSHSDTVPPTRTQISSRNERARPLSWHVVAEENASLEGDRNRDEKGNEIPSSNVDIMPRQRLSVQGDGLDLSTLKPSQKHVRFSSTGGNLEGFNYSRPIQYRSLQPSPSLALPQSSKGDSSSASSRTSSPRLLVPDQTHPSLVWNRHQSHQQQGRDRANSDITSNFHSSQLQAPQVHHHHHHRSSQLQPQSQIRVIYQNPSSNDNSTQSDNGHQRINHHNQVRERERQRPARPQHHPNSSTLDPKIQEKRSHSHSRSQTKISEMGQVSHDQRKPQPRLDDSGNTINFKRQQSQSRNRIEREIDSRSGGVGTNAFLVSDMVKDKGKGKTWSGSL